ncbi:MAG: putative alpha/beta superfamily hydrolase [Saprospiraceae bacterium]|jgi:predicted alpha/beta superfamily hydrolase
MKITKLLFLVSVISLNAVIAQEHDVSNDPQTIESANLVLPRIQVIPIKDTKADRQYELYIKLPEGYSEANDIQYPVLYSTDGMWHIELLSAATEYLIEDIILVGISWQKDINEDLLNEKGAHGSRFRDYSIRKSSNPEHQAKYQIGQASNHLAFIRNDVIKYMENKYRTDPNNRTYFGYSMGGKFGAYILLAQRDAFKNYILGSPSLKGDISYLSELGSIGESNRNGLNVNVFISYGALENELGGHAKEFVALLKDRNDESLALEHVVVAGDHQAAFPITGVRSVTWLSDLIKE